MRWRQSKDAHQGGYSYRYSPWLDIMGVMIEWIDLPENNITAMVKNIGPRTSSLIIGIWSLIIDQLVSLPREMMLMMMMMMRLLYYAHRPMLASSLASTLIRLDYFHYMPASLSTLV